MKNTEKNVWFAKQKGMWSPLAWMNWKRCIRLATNNVSFCNIVYNVFYVITVKME